MKKSSPYKCRTFRQKDITGTEQKHPNKSSVELLPGDPYDLPHFSKMRQLEYFVNYPFKGETEDILSSTM